MYFFVSFLNCSAFTLIDGDWKYRSVDDLGIERNAAFIVTDCSKDFDKAPHNILVTRLIDWGMRRSYCYGNVLLVDRLQSKRA